MSHSAIPPWSFTYSSIVAQSEQRLRPVKLRGGCLILFACIAGACATWEALAYPNFSHSTADVLSADSTEGEISNMGRSSHTRGQGMLLL
jgi:hypothetical protein